jgi:hypothetical protein
VFSNFIGFVDVGGDPPKSPKEIPLPSPLKRGKPEEATPLISRGTLSRFSPHPREFSPFRGEE